MEQLSSRLVSSINLATFSDLCPATKEYDKHKGTFYWPEAVAGYRVFLRCPYSVFKSVYAYRDCVVDASNIRTAGRLDTSMYNISWTEANIQNCPGPPLEQILNKWKTTLNKVRGMINKHISWEYNIFAVGVSLVYFMLCSSSLL